MSAVDFQRPALTSMPVQHPDDPSTRGLTRAAELSPCGEEVRRADAGVGERAGDGPAFRTAASTELESEESERDLRATVGAHAVVAALPVGVVPIDGALVRGDADLRHHTGVAGAQPGEKPRDQGEVAHRVSPVAVVRAGIVAEIVGMSRPHSRRARGGRRSRRPASSSSASCPPSDWGLADPHRAPSRVA